MTLSLSRVAKALSARIEGDETIVIAGAAEPSDAGPSDLALAMRPDYADQLGEGQARAAILWEGADWRALGLEAALFVQRPRLAMAHLSRMLDPGPEIAPGIHPSAVVHPEAEIGEGSAIGPLVVIGRGARIGARARIAAQASVAEDARIGDDALILQGARIGARVVVGARFIAQPGAVVGGDGLAFVTPEKSGVEQALESMGDRGDVVDQGWTRIHSLGTVEIGDDVEIGVNSCVDRGTIRATRIGSGCKLDNLCQIGHNVVMGRDCIAAALTGIGGSTVVGDRVVFGGATGVADNLKIGSDVITGGGTKVASNIPAGRVMMGYPAVRMDTHVAMYKALRRLPRLIAGLGAARKDVSKNAPND